MPFPIKDVKVGRSYEGRDGATRFVEKIVGTGLKAQVWWLNSKVGRRGQLSIKSFAGWVRRELPQ